MSGQRPGLSRAGSSIMAANKTIVLVTGGNAGIGLEIVKSLAESQSNYQILMGCRDTSKGETAAATLGAPTNVNPIQLDITDDESIDHCFKTIEQMFGKLDILINNAGTAGNDLTRDGSNPTPRQSWTHVLNTNVVSTGVLTERMIPLLQKSKLPKIIFITSELGSIGGVLQKGKIGANTPAYRASKSGMNMLTAHYALLYPNFKVNACCPGLRATGLHNARTNTPNDDPAFGAVNAVRLATEGPDGATATYTNTEGTIPW